MLIGIRRARGGHGAEWHLSFTDGTDEWVPQENVPNPSALYMRYEDAKRHHDKVEAVEDRRVKRRATREAQKPETRVAQYQDVPIGAMLMRCKNPARMDNAKLVGRVPAMGVNASDEEFWRPQLNAFGAACGDSAFECVGPGKNRPPPPRPDHQRSPPGPPTLPPPPSFAVQSL